jgi:hypothetical protein
LVGKPEGKRQLGRPRFRWEDNTKIDVREIWWCGVDWIDLARDRKWTIGFHKVLGSSWVAAQLAALQEGLSSMELVRMLISVIRWVSGQQLTAHNTPRKSYCDIWAFFRIFYVCLNGVLQNFNICLPVFLCPSAPCSKRSTKGVLETPPTDWFR